MPRRVTVPEFRPGDTVTAVLARLRERCLDVQYVSLPGGAPRGTVSRVEIPLAARNAPTATLPPPDGTPTPGTHLTTDLSRPVTVVVTR
ncbi:hypothetical protein ABZ896_34100 [Streptomyces sp. NPDC047072]|uniref:hypothetical protein n=1 Tax=Streptomyces sp. NPDC047072 TaxID=3154809 RepID=UPI0033D7951E